MLSVINKRYIIYYKELSIIIILLVNKNVVFVGTYTLFLSLALFLVNSFVVFTLLITTFCLLTFSSNPSGYCRAGFPVGYHLRGISSSGEGVLPC